jgi:glucose/arabinose dehydrogenase
MPVLKDLSLKLETVFNGLQFPSSMAFLGLDDILVLEKNQGTIRRILNGSMLPDPILQVNVSTVSERGMLGIAVSENATRNKTYVFVYYTESSASGSDANQVKQPLGNRLYRYDFVDDKLVNPKLLLDLPATPGPTHNGGKIVIGHDGNVYLVIGIVGPTAGAKTLTQNIRDGLPVDGRAGILRVTQDGNAVPNGGILGDTVPLSLYYAYGIRNSFGMDFDPETNNLWDTENGPNYGDEINLVEPGFNSGWGEVQGIWQPDGGDPGNATTQPENLTDFEGKGRYSAPEFTWFNSTGPTSLRFFDSDKFGNEYKNRLFVGDFHNGNIYQFELDSTRKSLALPEALKDGIADNNSELQDVTWGTGFGGITDMAVGPDGFLYVLALSQFQGGTNCDVIFGNPNKPCVQYSSGEAGTIFRVAPR